MGIVLILGYLFILVLVLVALLVVVIGGLLGLFLGGIIGGAKGGIQAPEDKKELATYQGITWGGCLGCGVGLALTMLLVILLWNFYLVNS